MKKITSNRQSGNAIFFLIIILVMIVALGLIRIHLRTTRDNTLITNKKQTEENNRFAPIQEANEEQPKATAKTTPSMPQPYEQKEIIASKSLESIVENNSIETLVANLGNDDWETSKKAADELATLGNQAVPELIKALPQASVAAKGQIVFLLGRIGDKQATPALLETLKDENDYIRSNAAEALGKIKDAQAISALTEALNDTEVSVRERAALALGELKDAQAVDNLLGQLPNENEERVKSAIVYALGQIKDNQATTSLISELKSQEDQLYKNEVVVSLGEIGDKNALPDLNEYLAALKQLKPTEPIVIFQWEQAIKLAEEAIEKINKNS